MWKNLKIWVIHNDGHNLIRPRDIGTVELGAATTETSGIMNGKSRLLGLFPTPTGNPLIIADGIRENLY